MTKKIKSILVANRGEIALRVMRTAREMGIKTIAVFSDADRVLPHVKFADEAVHIGPPAARDSYLKKELIIEVAKSTKQMQSTQDMDSFLKTANFPVWSRRQV